MGAVRPVLGFDPRLPGPAGAGLADILNAMQRVTIGDLKPDLTIILDIPVEVGLQQAAARRGSGVPDRFEAEDLQFHQDLRDAYGRSPPKIPQRCVLIDANADADTVAAHVWSAVRDHLFVTVRRGPVPHERPQVRTEIAVRHPRETADLFGHREAETALLNAYRSGRIPHAWLIGGPQGIGKATLAYRMARFVLANPDPMSPSVQRAETLALDPHDPVARQITASAHGGLLVLERGLNDRGVLRTVITVDETRETISFFGSTAAVDGWRVCIVDTVDELNPNAANALLKILEEPPQRSLFLLVSHSPARALPTILSRCRKLPLRPLATADVIRAAAGAADIAPEDPCTG